MKVWREKWKELSWFRRGLLLVMVTMVLGFGIATPVMAARKGYVYGDSLLYPEHQGELRRYTGKVDGETAVLTIRPENVVEYRWGEFAYGPYQVTEAPDAVPEDFWGKGIELSQADQVLFRGGYVPNSVLTLYDEDGEPVWELTIRAHTSTGEVMGEDGRVISQRELHQPGHAALVRWAMEPEELHHRGSIGLYLAVTLIALFNILQICFPGFFFRLSLWGRVRDPERAEPSDFYIAMEQIEWVVLAVVSAVLYGQAMTAIV